MSIINELWVNGDCDTIATKVPETGVSLRLGRAPTPTIYSGPLAAG